jgi:DASH complex subunit DAD3
MTATATSADSIFESNPYEMHPNLSPLEADVLWEYAKLSQHVKEVRVGVDLGRNND